MSNKETRIRERILLRGVVGEGIVGKILVEFSPESPFARVFVEGDEVHTSRNTSRIDLDKRVFIDGPMMDYLDPQIVIEVVEKLTEKWERKAALAEASTSELLRALWESLTIRG